MTVGGYSWSISRPTWGDDCLPCVFEFILQAGHLGLKRLYFFMQSTLAVLMIVSSQIRETVLIADLREAIISIAFLQLQCHIIQLRLRLVQPGLGQSNFAFIVLCP